HFIRPAGPPGSDLLLQFIGAIRTDGPFDERPSDAGRAGQVAHHTPLAQEDLLGLFLGKYNCFEQLTNVLRRKITLAPNGGQLTYCLSDVTLHALAAAQAAGDTCGRERRSRSDDT